MDAGTTLQCLTLDLKTGGHKQPGAISPGQGPHPPLTGLATNQLPWESLLLDP